MKIRIVYWLALLLPIVLIACSDDNDTIDDSNKVLSLKVINIENNSLEIISLDSIKIQVGVQPEDAIDKDMYFFKYTSGDENIFTVSANGVVTAKNVGEAALRVDALNNTDLWTICIVKVTEKLYPVESINVTEDTSNKYLDINSTFDLGSRVSILPANASDKNLIYISSDDMIATVDEKGLVTTKALGDIHITIKSTDGSGVEKVVPLRIRNKILENIDRTGWSVQISHTPVTDAAVNGSPASLIDGSKTTCMLMVKPGKTFGGVTIAATEEVFFVVDLAKKQNYEYIQLRHRLNNTSANLRVSKIDIYGSDDNLTYTLLNENATIATAPSIQTVEIELPKIEDFRYIKIVVKGWSTTGNTIQLSDFNVGNYAFEENIK